MKESKQFLKDKNIKPRISFKDGNPHVVKLINDKIDEIDDGTGKTVEGMSYLVEEDGDQKTFFTSSIGLISALSELEHGAVVRIVMKKKKGEKGYISFYEIEKVEDEDSLPVVEPDEEL